MPDRVRLRTCGGTLGTGVFLLGGRSSSAGAFEARPWICFLAIPVVPFGRARYAGLEKGTPGETWEVACEPLNAPPRSDLPQTLARALGAVLLALAPPAYAWTGIDQTGPLEALRVVIGAAAPVLVFMWRDIASARVVR